MWHAGNPNPKPDLATRLCAMYQGTPPETTYVQTNSVWYRLADMAREIVRKEDRG